MALWQHQEDIVDFVRDKEGSLMWWGMGCLAGDTELQIQRNLSDHNITIEYFFKNWSIKDSYKLLSIDPEQQISWQEVDSVSYSGLKEIYFLEFKSGRFIKCTEDHRFAVQPNSQWKQAKELVEHDLIYTDSNNSEPDFLIAKKHIGTEKTYDIAMKNSNNFMANGIIVHNSGKTFATINIFKELNTQLALIVCPKVVVKTWKKEFIKHLPGVFYIVAPEKGSVKKKAEEIEKQITYYRGRKRIVVILNYESAWRPHLGEVRDKNKNIIDSGLLRKFEWDWIVTDECQKISGVSSKISFFVQKLKAKQKLGLSGTPFAKPEKAYGIYRFLDKSIFGVELPNGKLSHSFQRWRNQYCQMGGFENRQIIKYINTEELNTKIHSIAHRIRTEDVVELPETQDIFIPCTLNRNARRAYDHFKKEALLMFENGEELTADNVLTKYLRLAQIASGTIKDDEGHVHHIDDSKIQELKVLIQGIDEPMVIFTWFRSEVIQIEAMVKQLQREDGIERPTAKIVGGCNEEEKFETGQADIAIVNIATGGVGLNGLVRARYGIYYSTGYNNLDFEQSRARICRPGSDVTKKTIYYHLTAIDTIDEVIKTAIRKKINIVKAIMDKFQGGL